MPLICYEEATEEVEEQGSSKHLSLSKLHKTGSIIRHIDKQTVTDWESKCAEQEIEIDQSKQRQWRDSVQRHERTGKV